MSDRIIWTASRSKFAGSKPYMPIPPPPPIMQGEDNPLPRKVLRMMIRIMVLNTFPTNIHHILSHPALSLTIPALAISIFLGFGFDNPTPSTPQTSLNIRHDRCPKRPCLFPPVDRSSSVDCGTSYGSAVQGSSVACEVLEVCVEDAHFWSCSCSCGRPKRVKERFEEVEL